MKFEKPIVFFDVETTGLDIAKDRIIEICMIKIFPDGKKKEKFYSKFNPVGVVIADGAFEKHGVTLESLKDEPEFKEKSQEIVDFIKDCDLGGYNCKRFDIPILVEEFYRAQTPFNIRNAKVFDGFLIFSKMESRKLEDAYRYYTGKVLENAHTAEADILATIDIFNSQIEKYNFETNTEDFDKIINSDNDNLDFAGKFKKKDNQVFITFGKHKDKNVNEVFKTDPNYFDWIILSDTFTQDTRYITKRIKDRLCQK